MNKMINDNEQLYSILKNCFTAIGCPRGTFYPDKDYGSKIKEYEGTLTAQQALDFARQAVVDMDGVFIKSADIQQDGIIFTVLVNSEEGQVNIKI